MKLLFVILFSGVILLGCKTAHSNKKESATALNTVIEAAPKKELIKSITPSSGQRFRQTDTIQISFACKSSPDSAILYFNNQRYGIFSKDNTLVFKSDTNTPVGAVSLRVDAFFPSEERSSKTSFITLLPKEIPQQYIVKKIKEYPHSTNSYTQGLEFYNGMLYESSGEYGKSFIEALSFPQMATQKRSALENRYFAEGITILKDKLYLLTWQEQKGFVFDAKTLKKEREFEYSTEGWGITSDGKQLYMSDGTQYIYLFDPETLQQTGKIQVYDHQRPVALLNELEWIDGKLWANIYGYNHLVIINPQTGAVEGVVDAQSLIADIHITDQTDVMNGIAYRNGNIFLTGKNWNKLFEVTVIEKK